MAIITFDIELINELDGSFMNFEYDYEIGDPDLTEVDIQNIADDLAHGVDPDLYEMIMGNLSIIPRVSHIEMD